MFVFKYYFASKSFAAVSKAFSNVYPDKDMQSKTKTRRLVTKFRDTGKACVCDKFSQSDKTVETAAVPTSGSASSATTGCGCENSGCSAVLRMKAFIFIGYACVLCRKFCVLIACNAFNFFFDCLLLSD